MITVTFSSRVPSMHGLAMNAFVKLNWRQNAFSLITGTTLQALKTLTGYVHFECSLLRIAGAALQYCPRVTLWVTVLFSMLSSSHPSTVLSCVTNLLVRILKARLEDGQEGRGRLHVCPRS